ncbi:MAG TPA: UvrD-helicase domain-containing protein [Thermoanaerobaculia bacterium]|nr:UvrD-helicase domain-containing protein [Thermoanaerobaculia bacterium]
MRIPADQDSRTRIENDTERSMIVEASAGTGKTSSLVSRILTLVLDGLPLSRIAAMTFTEKAAGELKERLAAALDARIASAPSLEERSILGAARSDLEAASISTIHSFAEGLLRERPVEAGIDPDFALLPEDDALALVRETFSRFVESEGRDPESPLLHLLRAGARLEELETLAIQLYARRSLVVDGRLESNVVEEARLRLGRLGSELSAVLAEMGGAFVGDAKGAQVRLALSKIATLSSLDLEELAGLGPEEAQTPFKLSLGSRAFRTHAAWSRLEKAAGAFKELLSDLSSAALTPKLVGFVEAVRGRFFAAVDARKRSRGFLDFDDLLLLTRNLLRTSAAARDHFRRRFEVLLVDEFQDTDPVQAEIVLRLTAPEPQVGLPNEALAPEGRALFVVGDPKQSIYRFRGADIETYSFVKELFTEEERVTLTTNFRSRPEILDYVNRVFSAVFPAEASGWEAPYAPFEPFQPSEGEARRVLYLVPPADLAVEEEDEAPRVLEARAVANLVLERFHTGPGSLRRIAVLLRRNDAIDLFRDVFRAAGIPCVLEGGASFFAREETAAVLAALRAIDEPESSILAVAALKSFLFALHDDELLEAARSGVRFSSFTGAPHGSRLDRAFALLSRLRRDRFERPLHETMADLLESRRAFAAMDAGAVVDGLQGAANLDRLLALARGLDRDEPSFHRALARLSARIDDREAEPRAFEDDEDAVRLVTLHKAKGLEYDVVIVADLGFGDPSARQRNEPIVYGRTGEAFAVRLSVGRRLVTTPGFAALEEAHRTRLDAEEKRLLYVAATRAREALVLSCFTKPGGEASGSLLSHVVSHGAPPAAVAEIVELVPARVEAPASPAASDDARNEEPGDDVDPERLLARARAGASRRLRRAGEVEGDLFAARGGSEEDRPAMERTGATRALEVGVAVHEAMERLLSPGRGNAAPDAADVEQAVAAATVSLDAPRRHEVGRLVARLVADPVVARALGSRRRFVELPLLFRDGKGETATLVEGKIDLLFEEDDGFTVVDWKTDRVDRPEDLREKEALYAPQLAAYAKGLSALLGPRGRIKETRLVFARG